MGITITRVFETKFVGVIIDSQLSWKSLINTVNSKIASIIGVISKIRYKLCERSAMLLYDSLIVSHLTYCNILWASNYKSLLEKTIVLQKRALRVCLGTSRKISSIELIKKK